MYGDIYYNIEKSPHHFVYCDYDFYFSSSLNLNKFLKNVDSYIEVEQDKLKSRYKVKLTDNIVLAFSYYRKIEKRGFKVLTHTGQRIKLKDVLGE